MARSLRVCAALTEYPSLVPSTHVEQLTTVYITAMPWDPAPFSALCEHLHTPSIYKERYTYT